MELRRVALQGELVRLEPLESKHREALARAALSDPSIWTHIPFRVASRDDVERLFEAAQKMHSDATAIVFATCVGDEVVGSTSIRMVDPATPSVEIGGTWIVPRWQRSRVNTEAKYLQCCYAFEALGVERIELKTDAKNLRSQAAIRRIGGVEEGTFRRHMRRADGTLRDSVYFSVIAEEWPRVKRALEGMLAAPADTTTPSGHPRA
ncbi:MAG TPA: GNAT family protein [Polyangiaceae bacterium]|nr:GNAT family protein [Polyangiaceae bacterium]